MADVLFAETPYRQDFDMRPAAMLSAGILLVALAGIGSASAAAGITPGARSTGDTVEQVRMGVRHHYRRSGRRVMGLPTPGTRARHSRTRLPRI